MSHPLPCGTNGYVPPDENPLLADPVETCEKCGTERQWFECWQCGSEGVSGHDCGEDCCCCLHPEDNMRCDICNGKGGWMRCFTCAPLGDEE